MREPRTEYVADLTATTDDYLRARLKDADYYAAKIWHRQERRDWGREAYRIRQEIDRRAGWQECAQCDGIGRVIGASEATYTCDACDGKGRRFIGLPVNEEGTRNG